MAKEYKYSICGMCSVRCPMQAVVEDGKVKMCLGNPHAPGIQGALCPRGAAGTGLINDYERPQKPLIRVGKRGEGKWREASWEEALDYVAEKLNAAREKYGDRTVLFSDRGGPFRDYPRALLRAIGTPNYCNHDASCARNVQHGALSLFGFGRKGVSYDLKNSKHVVLQTRNMLEAINVAECNNLLDAKDKGGKLTVIDIRAQVSGAKADNMFIIRPGTDYAFNLAVIHTLLDEDLYDKEFADMWIQDLDKLKDFVEPYDADWVSGECGVSAEAIRDFARQLAEAAPSVIWHPGWMNARYSDSFYVSRTAYIINSLLGSIGAKGGLPVANGPGDVDAKGLKTFMSQFDAPKEKRADGVGWKLPHIEKGPGLLNLAFQAIKTGDPYPVKAYIAWRHDPLMAFPDPQEQRRILDNLDLMVSVTFSWSDTAWFSDVVLPLSPYLERESIVITKKGPKPSFWVRFRAAEPRYDTKADWEIISGLAKRLGVDQLVYNSIEDIWKYQLEGTGYTIDDFKEKGFVSLADEPKYRSREELKFKTPSGKIEIISSVWEDAGVPSLKAYTPPEHPASGKFRITFGRCALHTQGHTVNNPLLNEQMPENILWINTKPANRLGIKNGECVEVTSNGYTAKIVAHVTDFIHEDAVFMIHGFGHKLPPETRAYGRGAADHELMPDTLFKYDPAGGGISLQENFVTVRKCE